MARASRSGLAADTSISMVTGREYREEVRRKKARKKYEKEQARSGGGNDRVSTRAKAMQIEALYLEPVVAALPHTPSPQQPSRRRTRQEKPACTDFGPTRHAFYNKPIPKWFFCAECDAWDRDKGLRQGIKQTSRRYKCIAGHTSFDFPTAPAPTKAKVMQRPKTLVQEIRRLEFEDSTTDLLEDTGVDLEAAETSDPNILTVIK
jgi:hypothetical protein